MAEERKEMVKLVESTKRMLKVHLAALRAKREREAARERLAETALQERKV